MDFVGKVAFSANKLANLQGREASAVVAGDVE
jgi:hypothetical protein